MRYSFIIPVYNRPEELQELLESIMRQSLGDYEVIVVEDGSTRTSEEVIQRFVPQISTTIRYPMEAPREHAISGLAMPRATTSSSLTQTLSSLRATYVP